MQTRLAIHENATNPPTAGRTKELALGRAFMLAAPGPSPPGADLPAAMVLLTNQLSISFSTRHPALKFVRSGLSFSFWPFCGGPSLDWRHSSCSTCPVDIRFHFPLLGRFALCVCSFTARPA